jgi:hypothetical protein
MTRRREDMKIHISRQGIIIRTVEIKGDKGSIGSGADCAVRLDDPYLAAHVADIVNRGGQWHIVDAASSIEGVSHNGRRIEDEAIVPGERYALGAFELIADPGTPAAAPPPAPVQNVAPARPAAPPTVAEGDRPPIPKTMFEAPMPSGLEGSSAPPPAPPPYTPPPPSGFQPIGQPAAPAPAAPRAQAPPPAKRSKLPLILALAALMFVVLILAAVMLMRGSGEKQVATPAATPAPAPTPTVPVITPTEEGNRRAAALEIDEALRSWESAIEAGDNELRVRYAKLAYDAAMVHAAANDPEKSKGYLDRVIKFGPADSPEVLAAKARIGS